MNTEQQKALPETELGRQLDKWADRVEPHTNKILFAALLVATLIVVGIVMYRGSKTSAESSWTAYQAASSADEMLNVANEFKETTAGVWARLSAGQQFLGQGLRQSLTDRDASDGRLKLAQEAFETVLKEKSAPAEAREQALRGLAVCLETQSDGSQEKNDAAIKAYQEIIRSYPDGTHTKWAEHRISELKTGAVQEFYAWFRKQNPKSSAPDMPLDGKESLQDRLKKLGVDMDSLPQDEDAKAKSATAPEATAKPAETPAPPSETPATTESPEKPAEPAATTPEAATPPAADTTPAEPAAEAGKPAEPAPEAGK